MCECLRGIFRVTWTPSSDADSDREDSHVFNRTRDPAVKDKRRSPPPRSPASPQHGGLTDEQESPERAVQKEKLHAELKQVLSQKRSHLRESTCQLAQPEMDSEPTDEQTKGVEDDFRKSVEIVVETDAEVGASGYSVMGGGERGIFVKDVLKDSPAAKHLSLQQGDQLLSAKVYFDNVRYEDALKILQCAEPYKVSFQLKRTVPETEVSVRPRILGGEVKGPKAKVAKMSVKGTKLFKTQRRRGGRFGLKRLKEKNKEDVVMDGTPPSLEAGDVDVEFSLPTFRQRKGVNEAEPVVGKGKKRIRFPHMKTKSYTGAVPGGKLGTRRLEVDENIFPPETSGAEVKTKGKGHKFGIAFPKSKHTKSGSTSQTGSLERKPPEVRIHPPSVEFDVSSVKDVEKRGLKLKSPDVEFALPSGKAGGSVSTVEETSESKAPKGDVRREADAAGGKVHADISKGDAKLRMPKLKLPKVRLSRHSDEIDSALQVKAPKAEMKGDDKIQLPEGPDIRMPKVEGDLSGGAASVQIPSVEISLPKVKGTFDADVSLPESGVKAGVNMPDIEVSGSEMDLQLNAKQKIPDEVEGMFKGPKISMPKVDISLPKTGSAGVEGPDVGGKISLPSVDISLPQMKSGGGDVDMGCYVGGDGKFKMPEFDPTFPDMKSSDREEEGTFKIPKVDLNLLKGKAGTTDDDGAAFQLPSMEVSLPKMKRNKMEVSTKGGKLKMPEGEFSPPKGNIQGGFEVEGQAGKEGEFKMPTVDVLMPKLKQAEGPIEGPEMMSGVEIQLPSHDASVPTAKMKGNIEIEGPSAKGGKFTMPSVNIKLPQMGSTEAGVDLHGQKMGVATGDVSLKPMGDIEGKVKGGKFTLPSVDICLPKMKFPKGDVTLEGPDLNLSLPSSGNKVKGDSDGGKFKMPTCDISLQKGKIKEGEMNIREPEVKGEKFQMPSFDVSLPQIRKRGEDVDVELPKLKGGEIKAPTIEISPVQGTFEGNFDLESDGKEGEFRLHGMKFPEGEGNFQGPKVKGAKFEMPKIDLSLPRGKTQGAFHTEIHSGKDGNIEMASCDFDVPKGELSADINVDGLERKTEKFKLPKIDISLPKLNLPEGEVKFEGPETKGQMEKPSLDIIPPEGKLDVDVDGRKAKGSKFHMPTININLPKIKSKEVSIDVKGPEGEEGKLPSCDITLPDKEFPEANVSLGGPNVKGGQINVPGVEGLLPETNGKAGISVETPEGNLEKLQMPKFDIAIPKLNFPDSAGKMKKPDLKIKKMEMPDIDIPLSKGKAEADIEIDGGKGKTFHIPSVDFSLPRIKTKGSEVKTGGFEEKIQMPDTDVSLSRGKVEVDTNVEGPEVKGGKFKMPKFDISFPDKNLPEGKPEVDISITKGKIKEDVDLGGKLPTVDFSPPKMQAKELHVDIKPPETANLHISSPNVALPGGGVKIECPNIKERKIEMPDIDLSQPKGKGKGDIETTGSSHKGGKFHMPAIDITLPKIKTKGAEVHVESPEVKGGQIKMPTLHVSGPKLKSPDIDVSLKGPEVEGKIKEPKGEVQGDFEVEGPDMKGGKFKMPKFDVSLPKVSLPKFDANVEGPDLKGKAEMLSVDNSVPRAATDVGVDVDTGKGRKFHMPSLDISLPKMKGKGFDVSFEGPEVKGDMSLPEIKSPHVDFNFQGPEVKGGKLSLPKVDIALPKTEGDFEVEGPDIKGGRFKMPKFNVSLPKVSLPKFDASVEGPDLKGKAEMPSVDISVPKRTTDLGVDVDTGKGSKFHMPSLDLTLPKMKTKGLNVNVERPEVKGDMSLSEIKSPDVDVNIKGPEVEEGYISLPNVDVAFPKTEGDYEVEGPDMKGGKFKMPKFDLSLPKVSLPKFDASVEGPDLKGKAEMQSVDISVPKATTDVGVDVDTGKGSKFHMPSLDISLPKMKAKGFDVNIEGPKVKGDMSLSEIKSPHVDFNFQGPEVKGGKLSLPKVDIALPKTEGDYEVEGPDIKGGKFKMPKFDVSLPKVSLPKFDASVEGPDLKGKAEMLSVDISVPKGTTDLGVDVDTGKGSKFHMPSLDITLPKMKAKGFDVNIEGPKVRGDMSLPEIKSPDVDVNLKGLEVEGGYMSLPNVDVAFPKTEGDFEVEGPDMKGGKFKMPKLPKVSLPEEDVKVKAPDINVGKIEMPDIDISLPKGKEKGDPELEGHTGKRGKFHLPAIDISLPKIKTKEPEIHIKGPEVKGGKIPDIDFSLPRGEVDADLNLEGPEKRGQLKMPKVDVSLPKFELKVEGKVEGIDAEGKTDKTNSKISLPEEKVKGNVNIEGHSGKTGKFHLPSIDFSLPKIKVKGKETEGLKCKGEISIPKEDLQETLNVEGSCIKESECTTPTFDVSLPKVALTDGDSKIEGPDIKGRKIQMPDIDLSLPKGKGKGDIETTGSSHKGGKFYMPAIDITLPKMKTKGAEVHVESPKVKGGQIKIPSLDVSGPKLKSPDIDVSLKGPEVEGNIKNAKGNISLPKGEVQGDFEVEGPEMKGGKFKMPKFDVSLPKVSLPKFDASVEGPDLKGKAEMPSVYISVPKATTDVALPKPEGDFEVESPDIKGGKFKMPKFDLSLPKVSLPKFDASVEGPDLKGKAEMQSVDISVPKATTDVEVDVDTGKGSTFHMPSLDISLPKIKAKGFDVNIEGPEFKGDISLPEVRSPDVDFNLQGPEVEGGKLGLPKVNVALPKTEGDFEVEGPDMKGGKFKMPKFDVSLPKVSLPKFDASVEGPDLKGKAEIRSVEMSVPKGTTDLGVDVDTGKFYMPSLDISLPKMKGKKFDVNVEGPEVKGDISLPEVRSPDVDFNLQGSEVEGGNLGMPNVDIALPKTEGDIEVEGPDMKGGKFKMPKFDLSLPKVSLPKFDASVEGPDLKGKAEIQSVDISVPKETTNLGVDVDTGKGSKFHMPSLDISLPKMKGKGFDVNIEGPEVKGDISLPEVKSPDVDFNFQGPEVKGGKLSLPKVDIALPKTEGDFEVEGPDIKGGKFKMPKFDVSLPNVSLPKFDASVEGPDLKGKAEMPSVDISVPKGTTNLGVDVDTGKGSKFHMPSLDISLPKMKTKGLNVNVEGPEVRGDMPLPKIKTPVTDVNLQSPEVERGDVKMPTLDVSLPKPEGDSEIQGPEVKGGKYKMPKLPKVSLPEANVKVIGPDINVGKIEMPDIDISLPKGKAKGDPELEGHTGKRGKFHLPAIDISLPKIKTKEPEIHIKGPEVKGGKIPDIDFSLPRGEGDADLNLEGPEKRGQVKMPKVDVSFPQIKLAGDVIVEGPEMKGKITEPVVDFSKGERKMEGDIKKAMGLHMPSIDLHLPKVDFDLSLPSGSKGRGLKVDTSGPDASADVQMSGIKGQLKPPKIKATDASINTGSVDNPGASLKLPTVKLPTVDISAPKVDLDFGLTKSIGDEVEVQLLKAEGGRPLSGGSFDLPDVSLKAPSFTFPRFGGKSKSSELQISKSEVFISPPDVEGEVKTPSVEFDDEGKVKVKKNKIKIPSFRLSKKDPDVSVSCPDVDVKGKKENVDIQTQKISVEGSSDKTKYKVKLPKFKISSPTAKLPEKEGDMRVEADRKGGFHAPDVTIKLPKFSMPGFGSKEKDLGKPVGEVETKTKLKMPSVELSLQETKTPDTEVLLPKAEVDVSEADIRGYEGNLKVPKMPEIDVSIPKVDPDVSLPKGKSQKIEKPDMDVKGEGKFKIPQIKMPPVDIDIPKGKSVLPDVEVDVDRGKFNMPYVKMPSVDITLPKPKTGKALDVDAEGDGRLRMPDIKMPNVNISEGTNNKLEGPNVDIQGRGKLKTADVYASDLETPDGKTDWDSERSFKMPSVDISLPKGKLKGNNTPEMEMGVQGQGKVKLPHMKMPDFDVSFPKRRTKDSQMEIKDKGGKLKTPNVSTPPIDISLSTGKDTEVEESSGGKFKMPIWKRPDVDIPLPKGHMEGPEVESTGERGGLKMPHISLPSVDISLPKRRADAPHVERGDGEEKCTTLYMKMPSVDPNFQLKGEEGPKFQMPHVKMPNIEFSLPKGKDIPKLKTEGEEGKVRMPSVDISIPTGKIPGPNAEAEGRQGPHIKMPYVNITLPRGKSDKIEGAELETEREGKSNISHMTLPSVDISLPRGQTKDYSPDIKGERKKFKMAKEDFSLPKGRSLVEGLDVGIKGDPSMAAAKAEGGHIKLPHMKFPKVDISLPKGRSRGTSSSAIEMDVTSPEGNIPKVPSSKAEIELPTAEAQSKLKVPQGAHLDSSSEGNQASLKLKIPTIEIKSPKEDLDLQTGSHKEEGIKDNKKIELPDLDLTLEGSGGKGKGLKNKGAKFKIRKHKKKTCKDTSAKPQSEEEAGEQVKHNSSKDGVNVQLPGVTPPTVSLKTKKCDVGGSSPSTAEVRVPRIPDIEFDIGTSQDEEDGQTENKIKIPKFGIPLPSISSPERLAHGPEIQYEGPKIPKVKKAVFVLVNPSEPDDSVAGPSLQKEQTKAETEIEEATVKISKKKSSFGKSKDKSATESAERRVEEEEISRGLKMKMPKVKFSPAKSGSFGVKGDSSSPNGEKDASPHKDDKGTFGGKLKLPKVELTSPYGKMAAGEENKGARFQKDSSLVEVKTEFRGLPAPAESAGDVVTSHARTEMLDRDRSEIPDGLEFSSAKVQMWSESKEAEERESSSWFKVPKVTLKPLSSGFLQITPEGSPQEQRKGEVAGMEDVSGSFCIHASGLDFAAQQMSEEHHASEEGTVTMVTKTTRITRQIVTSQTHTAESSTTTSRQVSDSNF